MVVIFYLKVKTQRDLKCVDFCGGWYAGMASSWVSVVFRQAFNSFPSWLIGHKQSKDRNVRIEIPRRLGR